MSEAKRVNAGLEKAISLCGGHPSELARRLGHKTPSRIGNWRATGVVPPAEILPMVIEMGGLVRPYDIDQTLYPDKKWLPPGVLKKRATRKFVR